MKTEKNIVNVNLLGAFNVSTYGQPLRFPYKNSRIVCAYLMTEGYPVCREYLSSLLWPNHDKHHSLQNLRQSIATIKRLFGTHFQHMFSISRSTIEFVGASCSHIDIELLRHHSSMPPQHDDYLSNPDLYLQYTASFSGVFCSNFYPNNNMPLYDWLATRRMEFHSMATRYTRNLVNCYRSAGLIPQAIDGYQRMLSLVNYDQLLAYEFMEYLIRCNKSIVAINFYKSYANRLEATYGLMPDKSISHLYEVLCKEHSLCVS